jgi:hypothetical protein
LTEHRCCSKHRQCKIKCLLQSSFSLGGKILADANCST